MYLFQVLQRRQVFQTDIAADNPMKHPIDTHCKQDWKEAHVDLANKPTSDKQLPQNSSRVSDDGTYRVPASPEEKNIKSQGSDCDEIGESQLIQLDTTSRSSAPADKSTDETCDKENRDVMNSVSHDSNSNVKPKPHTLDAPKHSKVSVDFSSATSHEICSSATHEMCSSTNSPTGTTGIQQDESTLCSGRDKEIQCQLLLGTSSSEKENVSDEDKPHSAVFANACVQTNCATQADSCLQTDIEKLSNHLCHPQEKLGVQTRTKVVVDCGVQYDVRLVAESTSKTDKVKQRTMANAGGRVNNREYKAYGPPSGYDNCCVS